MSCCPTLRPAADLLLSSKDSVSRILLQKYFLFLLRSAAAADRRGLLSQAADSSGESRQRVVLEAPS